MISNENEIGAFLHCATCIDNGHKGIYDVGYTEIGLQIWCTVCDTNVMHIDFEGQTHPANTSKERRLKLVPGGEQA